MDMNNIRYIYVDEDKKLETCLSYLDGSGILGIDTETSGLDSHQDKLRLVQIADGKNPVAVIDVAALSASALDKLKLLLQTEGIKVFQNAKFDLKFLKAGGFEVRGQLFDTMLAAQIVRSSQSPNSYSLETLAEHYLGVRLPKEEQRSDWRTKLTESQLTYAARDAAILLPLREKLVSLIKADKLVEVCKLEFDCLWAVVDMEYSGIGLDKEKWQKLYDQYMTEQNALTKKLNQELGDETVQLNLFGEEVGGDINLDSPAQLMKALKQKGIVLQSTSHGELMAYKDDHEVIRLLLEYRRVSKALQGFLSPMAQHINGATNRIHSSYWQIGAHSGRFACGNPNIQQIPRGKEFRECFVPDRGNKFIIADYSQVELRVAAEIAMDKTMIEAYRKGEDLHALTAALIAGKKIEQVSKKERQAAKAVNFGLIYAMGAKGLQAYAKNVYGIDMTLQEAEVFRDRFFKAYRGIADWHAKMKKAVNVRESRTLSGRRCVYSFEPGITGLLNTPVQGTAADIAKKALGLLVPAIKEFDGHIIATVHDEILLEVPEASAERAAEVLKAVMEKAGAYFLKHVPVTADTVIADSWAEK